MIRSQVRRWWGRASLCAVAILRCRSMFTLAIVYFFRVLRISRIVGVHTASRNAARPSRIEGTIQLSGITALPPVDLQILGLDQASHRRVMDVHLYPLTLFVAAEGQNRLCLLHQQHFLTSTVINSI